MSIQSRNGSISGSLANFLGLSYSRVTEPKGQPMSWKMVFRAALTGIAVAAGAAAGPASAQALDKVTFGTNWVAEAEHGGFYQALADGTYRKYGLDVTIRQGGPNANNRILLPVGKIDFFLSANNLEGFDAVTQNIPTIEVAAFFQKDPQVLIAHPDQGIEKLQDLKNLTLFVSQEGVATYYQWLKADLRLQGFPGEAVHLQSAAVPGGQEQRDAGLCDVGAVRDREGRAFHAESLFARRRGPGRLFDADRDAPRPGRQETRSGASALSMPRSSAGTTTSITTTAPPMR